MTGRGSEEPRLGGANEGDLAARLGAYADAETRRRDGQVRDAAIARLRSARRKPDVSRLGPW